MTEAHELTEAEALQLVLDHEALENNHDLDGLMTTLTEDCVYDVVPIQQEYHGQEEARDYYAAIFEAFPDFHLDGKPIAVTKDCVIWEGTVSGTFKGSFMGFKGTGKRFEARSITVFPIQNGKLDGERIYFDLATVMAQLGVAPPPPLPGTPAFDQTIQAQQQSPASEAPKTTTRRRRGPK